MSIARIKVWNPGDVLTAADLNGELNNILNNPVALWSPANQNVNFNGKTIILDGGAVSTLISTTSSGLLFAVGTKTGGPGTATGAAFDVGTYTFTDNLTAPSGTAPAFASVAIHQPTVMASSTGVTTTDAATFYVEPPLAGTNETITNAWAAWFAGQVRFDAAIGGLYAPWSTGDAKLTFKIVADAGWIIANDGSIGSASSGATTRANADTKALYTLLWNNIIDTWAPVSTGRGASAVADFSANKTLTIPRVLGRAIAIAGTGTGLTARVLGQFLGSETISVAAMPSHNHVVNDPGHSHIERVSDTASNLSAIGLSNTNLNYMNDTTTSVSTTGISIQNTGSGAADGNMQPETFMNIMIKL